MDDIARLGLETEREHAVGGVVRGVSGDRRRECVFARCIIRFCERKQHWKGEFGLHWPVTQSDRLKVDLAKKIGGEEKRRREVRVGRSEL